MGALHVTAFGFAFQFHNGRYVVMHVEVGLLQFCAFTFVAGLTIFAYLPESFVLTITLLYLPLTF